MIFIELAAHVPSKSNTMQIGKRGAKCITYKPQDIIDFETQIAGRAKLLRSRGVNVFTNRVELWIIWHRRTNDGRRRDLDNIMKSIKDGLTKGELWNDDSQVSCIHEQLLYDTEEEWLQIIAMDDPYQPYPKKTSTSKSSKPSSKQ